jgi:L-lactate dehydrogenase complex protein LldG
VQLKSYINSCLAEIIWPLTTADKMFNTFGEAMQTQKWPEKMPTNAVLISGPSKTADIELTLAFGVHGPKELIVLILS